MVVLLVQNGLDLSERLRTLPFSVFGRLVADGWRCAAVRSGVGYQPVYVLVDWADVQRLWDVLLTVESPGPSLPMFVSHHWTPKALIDAQGQLGAWVTPLYILGSAQLQWSLTLAFGNADGCYPAAIALAEAIREITVSEAR